MDFEDWGVVKVYRRLRDDEDVRDGLRAKDPDANMSIQDHVENGSKSWYESQYISCCKTKYAMQKWISMGKRTFPNAPVRVAEINVSAMTDNGESIRLIDLTEPYVCYSYLPTMKARRFAGLYEEVLIVGRIRRKYVRQFDVFLDIPVKPTPRRVQQRQQRQAQQETATFYYQSIQPQRQSHDQYYHSDFRPRSPRPQPQREESFCEKWCTIL